MAVASVVSCNKFDVVVVVVVQQSIAVAEAAVEEVVAEVVMVAVVPLLHRDLNLMNDDDYYEMNGNLDHHLFVAKYDKRNILKIKRKSFQYTRFVDGIDDRDVDGDSTLIG